MYRVAIGLAILMASTAVLADDVPKLELTPGSVRTGLTKAKIFAIKWGRDERHVTDAMKLEVFRRYGYSGNDDPHCIPAGQRHCEIDHLISRELGGADEVLNLWPQAYGSSPWNAVLKDKLENRLHREICGGNITLAEGRKMLVQDWREAYQKYFGAPQVH
jgi:hypothetical protein